MYIAAGITFICLTVSWFLAPETASRNLNDAASLDEELPPQSVTRTLSKHSQ
ncbi:hypothetical protein [Pantoea rodasii]